MPSLATRSGTGVLPACRALGHENEAGICHGGRMAAQAAHHIPMCQVSHDQRAGSVDRGFRNIGNAFFSQGQIQHDTVQTGGRQHGAGRWMILTTWFVPRSTATGFAPPGAGVAKGGAAVSGIQSRFFPGGGALQADQRVMRMRRAEPVDAGIRIGNHGAATDFAHRERRPIAPAGEVDEDASAHGHRHAGQMAGEPRRRARQPADAFG
jgi:hypothetical protein